MGTNELGFLVIDDDDFQRQCLINLLKSLGAERIYDAMDGVQALSILRNVESKLINIVLCDLDMPEMDGLEFFRHLGKANSSVSIIIISALDSALIASVKEMARAYGLNLLGAVEKPIMLTQLEELISSHASASPKFRRSDYASPCFNVNQILHGIRNKQFEPYFQPKIEITSKKIVGAEALARWIHPEHGVISPVHFIGLLEESGNIDELTFIMLDKAAASCCLLHYMGYPITISVNLSLKSLSDTALADKVTKIVLDNGVSPHYIILEITESVAMTEVATALENLARLRMRGFGLSIDDYGTGYSSMQQIMRIAFSELKIDQSFVKNFSESNASQIIADSSIELAHRLQMYSTAEGIETCQDLEMLASMGCDLGQGYFIARPMNVDSLIKFCASDQIAY
jgi:EAL domain-containing protein (putative c-di-GMP-specific phosphodiesterase class I)/FixJ family two-component response regulator